MLVNSSTYGPIPDWKMWKTGPMPGLSAENVKNGTFTDENVKNGTHPGLSEVWKGDPTGRTYRISNIINAPPGVEVNFYSRTNYVYQILS